MNRRRFLQYTIALAATAPLSTLGLVSFEGGQLPPVPLNPSIWVPTQAEVDEWLTYYKLAVRQGCERFVDVVLGVPAETLEQETGPHVEFKVADQALFDAAEHAFLALEGDRRRVGVAQGFGYAYGRDGHPRFNAALTAPSNESLAWYNGWATGNLDYRWWRGEVKLPRSPGVSGPKKLS